MLTHFIKSINWVDVALVILLVRLIFIGVKNGFITEVCKFLGVLLSLCIALHFYPMIPFPALVAFLVLVGLGYGFFFVIRLGLGMLFKAETQHEGFDKYAAGVIAIGRGFLTASLVIFALLLSQQPWLIRQARESVAYKLAGSTSVHTYSLIYNQIVAKIVGGQHFNEEVYKVLGQRK